MTVKTMDPTRVVTLEDHLRKAAEFDPVQIDRIRGLATQLSDRPVLPLLGSGASYDCGMRLAAEIGQDLYDDYVGDPGFAPHVGSLEPNMGAVADAIFTTAGQVGVVRAVGLPDPALWPGTNEIQEHFCGHRVLARLAREEVMEEVLTLNWDCQHESALEFEGFMRSPRTERGKQWLDHATVVSDAATYAELQVSGSLKLIKAHGCAARYRELAAVDEEAAAETIIIRDLQLATWRTDLWIRDAFRDRARNHVLLLIGCSGQDPVLYGELNDVLQDVYRNAPTGGIPRVVVIDPHPDTARLRNIIQTGLGGQAQAEGTVTQVQTASGSVTAALLILLAESLALKLADHGVAIPDNMSARLAALTLSTPAMLRWSYLLRRREENQYVQKVNLQQAAARGYVPVALDPETSARALNTRMATRAAIGLTEPETTEEVLQTSGFLVHDGCAYLPVGLDHDELLSSCRPGGPIEDARESLPHPRQLDCILVSDDPGGRRGVHIVTGSQVDVP
jgi:hypothetical protein